MKKIIFLIIITVLINHKYANAKAELGYLGYSYSKETIDGKKISNHSIGQEILFNELFDFNTAWFLGANYKFGDNGKSLTTHFLINPIGYVKDFDYCFVFSLPAIGTNVSYNFEKKIYGIGPQVDLVTIIYLFFKLNITYRYNIYFKAHNTHEIGFTVSIMDYFEMRLPLI